MLTSFTAANMAVPIRFAIDLLKKAGWLSPDELQKRAEQQSQLAETNSNTSPGKPQNQ